MLKRKMSSENKIFWVTFSISLVTHTIILLQNANLTPFSLNKKEERLEVSYVVPPPKKPTERQSEAQKFALLKKDLALKSPTKIIPQRIPLPLFRKSKDILEGKPALIKSDIVAVKTKITLPPVEIDKSSNPAYTSYYQLVREKIRRAAYQNYSGNVTGEVYLSFIIAADGDLKEVRLLEKKSSASKYLQEVALSSIKDAAPFPNFPLELDYPLLSFNAIISFQIE